MVDAVTLGSMRRMKQVTMQGLNIVANSSGGGTGQFLVSFTDNIAATSGGNQATGKLLTTQFNRVTTSANAADSVLLPASITFQGATLQAGAEVVVINAGANSIQVFGSGTDTINGIATATGVPQAAGATVTYRCTTNGKWYTAAGGNSALPITQFTTAAITVSGTFAAGQLTGADYTTFSNSSATPGTVTSRTAAQMYGDIPNAFVGQTYLLRIIQTGGGTLTFGAGSNVTITGTATVSTSTWREFVTTLVSATSVVFQNVGSGSV